MMFFNHPDVKKYLLEHGEVYTIREKKRREGNDVFVVGRLFKTKKIGRGTISLVKSFRGLKPVMLNPFVKKSGLKSSNAWLGALKSFCNGKIPKIVYLYRVHVIKGFVQGEKKERGG